MEENKEPHSNNNTDKELKLLITGRVTTGQGWIQPWQ